MLAPMGLKPEGVSFLLITYLTPRLVFFMENYRSLTLLLFMVSLEQHRPLKPVTWVIDGTKEC